MPADQSVAMLDEFVELAAASTVIWGKLDVSEHSERLALFERHFERWSEEYQLNWIALNEGVPIPCLEADYKTDAFTVSLYSSDGLLKNFTGDFEYLLTAAQFETAYAACVNKTAIDRLRFLDQYVRSLSLWPSRILMLYGCGDEESDTEYFLELFSVWDETYYELRDDFDSVELTREQFDAFAVEWYPLSPQERAIHMEKAFRSLHPGDPL